jgi:toxin ParE1/3/4
LASVIWEEAALRDIERLSRYIGESNPAAARKVRDTLLSAGDSLKIFPNRARRGVVPGTRELIVRNVYVVAYRTQDEEVRIIRVWHHARKRD